MAVEAAVEGLMCDLLPHATRLDDSTVRLPRAIVLFSKVDHCDSKTTEDVLWPVLSFPRGKRGEESEIPFRAFPRSNSMRPHPYYCRFS
jgi:hypothetical protein